MTHNEKSMKRLYGYTGYTVHGCLVVKNHTSGWFIDSLTTVHGQSLTTNDWPSRITHTLRSNISIFKCVRKPAEWCLFSAKPVESQLPGFTCLKVATTAFVVIMFASQTGLFHKKKGMTQFKPLSVYLSACLSTHLLSVQPVPFSTEIALGTCDLVKSKVLTASCTKRTAECQVRQSQFALLTGIDRHHYKGWSDHLPRKEAYCRAFHLFRVAHEWEPLIWHQKQIEGWTPCHLPSACAPPLRYCPWGSGCGKSPADL